jgi:hypothetical protein
MKLSKIIVIIYTVVVITTLAGGPTQASRVPRIELLRAVRVTGTRVLLSDLLPANVPESLRASAAQISMGAAPQPGNTRIFEHDAVERRAGESEELLTEVSVPERIVVSRDSRPITLSEVFEAIRSALHRSGAPGAAALQPGDVFLESQVFVGPGDSGLRVMRVDLDRGLRRARFLLWPSRSPKVLPFFVTVQFAGEMPLAPLHPVMEFRRIAQHSAVTIAAARPPKQEILVAAGESATLTLHSDTLRIFVDVVSLERGTLGQQIRVRMPETGKIFNAQVDGRGHLEVKF